MNLKKDIEDFVSRTLEGELVSGKDHLDRMYMTSRQIAKTSSIDYDDQILHAACYLHDIDHERPHEERSAKVAENFLKEIGFPENKILKVTRAILTHIPDKKPLSKEGSLLHDAYIIDFLGASGSVRLSIASLMWFGHKDLKGVKDTLKGYRDLYDKLILDNSKKIAKNKTIVMDMFIRQLEDEIR